MPTQPARLGGFDIDPSTVARAYLRDSHGDFTTFHAPGAGNGPGQGTGTVAIISLSPERTITGTYIDCNIATMRFTDRYALRTAPSTVSTRLVQAPGQWTDTDGLNPAGTIPGPYFDSNSVLQRYVRARDGTVTTFDALGAGADAGRAHAASRGETRKGRSREVTQTRATRITGFFRQRTVASPASTLRARAAGQGSFPLSDNPLGTITGCEIDANGAAHGFPRTP